jgi:hypothetical protein
MASHFERRVIRFAGVGFGSRDACKNKQGN